MTTDRRVYLLNENHQVPADAKSGGGAPVKYVNIDWGQRGDQVGRSLRAALVRPKAVRDPTTNAHHYLLALPAQDLKFDGTKDRQPVTKPKRVLFSGAQASIFKRLQLDLIGNVDGAAIVHVSERNRTALEQVFARLPSLGSQTQSAAATIAEFAPIPRELRLSPALVDGATSRGLVDVVIELQPVLSLDEADLVLATIGRYLNEAQADAVWRRMGRDSSRRAWARIRVRSTALPALVDAFPAIQSIHEPLPLVVQAPRRRRAASPQPQQRANTPNPSLEVTRTPVVAVVDGGVADAHSVLAPYVQARYRVPGLSGHRGHHGSKVASRVVFPPLDEAPLGPAPGPYAFIVDVNVADADGDERALDAKSVVTMMEVVTRANPDVRVFNLSFGMNVSLDALREADSVLYGEALRLMGELDNFASRADVLIVTPAGNLPPVAVPSAPYPGHREDPQWRAQPMGALQNAVKVGATVGHRISTYAVVQEAHAPSRFCRVGLGSLPAVAPELSEVGGNEQEDGVESPWVSVPVLDQRGDWQFDVGTSFACPVVARAAAFLWRRLSDLSITPVSPYSVTVRACLALTAERPPLTGATLKLADLTLGFGYPRLEPWFAPPDEHALFVWQGQLAGPGEPLHVTLPIPMEWLKAAREPTARVIWCWDPPVNQAVPDLWRCRDVSLVLRDAVGKAHNGKPIRRQEAGSSLRGRTYELDVAQLTKKGLTRPHDGLWILEVIYKKVAELSDVTVSSLQRVAVAVELLDRQHVESPRAHLEQMPITATMTRLSVSAIPMGVPITVGG